MKVAFIGLGAMGLPMARRLSMAEGVEVVAFDLSPERLAQAAQFTSTADSFKAAVTEADAVFSVVPADAHVMAIARDLVEHGEPGQLFVDFSTISPQTIVTASEMLRTVEITTVSAALTRSTAAAEAGELVLFSSDFPAEHQDALATCFNAMSIEVLTMPVLGGPKAIKLANNMIIACIDVAVDEAIVLGEALGLSASTVVERIRKGGGDSWAIVNHIEKYVLPDELGPGRFSTRYMAKDVSLFSDMALDHDIPAVLAGLVGAQYRGTVAMGLGDHYHMVVKRWQELSASRALSLQPVPVGIDIEQLLSALGLAIGGVHVLSTEDALAAAVAWGVDRREAAAHLLGGSAGNDYLRHILDDAEVDQPSLERLREGLDHVAAVSGRMDIPSILLEASRRLIRTIT